MRGRVNFYSHSPLLHCLCICIERRRASIFLLYYSLYFFPTNFSEFTFASNIHSMRSLSSILHSSLSNKIFNTIHINIFLVTVVGIVF
jgi:hypothetical protein